ncbi:MAG TPA: hypothetical protein VF660_11760 [Actinomycetota bacterium]|jgi:hypothetical protein
MAKSDVAFWVPMPSGEMSPAATTFTPFDGVGLGDGEGEGDGDREGDGDGDGDLEGDGLGEGEGEGQGLCGFGLHSWG